jgi:hypothetical protein
MSQTLSLTKRFRPFQLFHICYPVTLADGEETMYKWTFICPNQTVFDQVTREKSGAGFEPEPGS